MKVLMYRIVFVFCAFPVYQSEYIQLTFQIELRIKHNIYSDINNICSCILKQKSS